MTTPLITIKKSAEFKAVYGKGRSAANKYLVAYVAENQLNTYRFGITVSRKIGIAVRRNKVRRRIREVIRLLCLDTKAPYFDIVIIARQGTAEATFAELCKGLDKLINKLLREKPKSEVKTE